MGDDGRRGIRLGRDLEATPGPGATGLVLRLVLRLREADVSIEDSWERLSDSASATSIGAAAPRPQRGRGAWLAPLAVLLLLGAAAAASLGPGCLQEDDTAGCAAAFANTLGEKAMSGIAALATATRGAGDLVRHSIAGTEGASQGEGNLSAEPPSLLLRSGGARVDGFLGARNLAPGDRVHGALLLASEGDDSSASIAFRLDLRLLNPGPDRLDEALVVEKLAYGDEDLIARGGLDPDGDGRVSLREAAEGVGGLPPPGRAGRVFDVALVFDPATPGDGTQFAGQRLEVDVVFTLSEVPFAS